MLIALTPSVQAADSSSGSLLIPSLPDLIWGTLAFVIVLVFMIWKVVPTMNKALDARRDAIEGSIERAEKAQAEATAVLDNYTSQLSDARAEAARIREAAREEGKKIVAEHRDAALVEAARVHAAAAAQLEADRKAAEAQLRSEVGTLAIDLASGVVGESLKDDKKAVGVVERFLAELESQQKAGANS